MLSRQRSYGQTTCISPEIQEFFREVPLVLDDRKIKSKLVPKEIWDQYPWLTFLGTEHGNKRVGCLSCSHSFMLPFLTKDDQSPFYFLGDNGGICEPDEELYNSLERHNKTNIHSLTWPRYCVLHGRLDPSVDSIVIRSMKMDLLIDNSGLPICDLNLVKAKLNRRRKESKEQKERQIKQHLQQQQHQQQKKRKRAFQTQNSNDINKNVKTKRRKIKHEKKKTSSESNGNTKRNEKKTNNRTGYRCVGYITGRKSTKYRLTCTINFQRYHGGHFPTSESAALAYDRLVVYCGGGQVEKKKLNFPENYKDVMIICPETLEKKRIFVEKNKNFQRIVEIVELKHGDPFPDGIVLYQTDTKTHERKLVGLKLGRERDIPPYLRPQILYEIGGKNDPRNNINNDSAVTYLTNDGKVQKKNPPSSVMISKESSIRTSKILKEIENNNNEIKSKKSQKKRRKGSKKGKAPDLNEEVLISAQETIFSLCTPVEGKYELTVIDGMPFWSAEPSPLEKSS